MREPSFAQVLDQLIDDGECTTLGPSVTTAPIGGAPFVHRWGYIAVPFVRSSPRPRRVLNTRMRAALDVLRSAGAVDLGDDFLGAELKTAFRRLARSAHPDMHPRASEHDKRGLVARFQEIREAYATLSADGCPS